MCETERKIGRGKKTPEKYIYLNNGGKIETRKMADITEIKKMAGSFVRQFIVQSLYRVMWACCASASLKKLRGRGGHTCRIHGPFRQSLLLKGC